MSTTRARLRSRRLVIMGVVTALILTMSVSAQAEDTIIEISIPLTSIVRTPEGTVTELASAEVPGEFAGHICEVTAHTENQNSVHEGNDIVVASGSSQVLLADVEGEPGKAVDAQGSLELGDTITVSLIMGPEGVFSAGFDVVARCVPEPPTTTTVEVQPTQESTTTTAAVTTEPSVEDEVKGTEVLPFTGPQDPQLGLLAVALVAGGALLLVGTRRRED